jgi:hypothetical protein
MQYIVCTIAISYIIHHTRNHRNPIYEYIDYDEYSSEVKLFLRGGLLQNVPQCLNASMHDVAWSMDRWI